MTWTATRTPSTTAAARWKRRGSDSCSWRSTPSNVMTNRNNTTIALAYTTIWIAATNAACSWRNNTATPTSVVRRYSAECTGFRARTTPNAPASITAAHTKNTTASIPMAPTSAVGVLLVEVRLEVFHALHPVGLAALGGPNPEAELPGPAHEAFVGRRA